MASAVDICNLGLANLGQGANVQAIVPPDGSAEAEHCARFYPIARDALLEMHAWSFATKRAALAEFDITPPDSWQYAYAVPNDGIKPVKVLMPEATDDADGQDFELETTSTGSTVLYTNVENATAVYIARVTDTTRFTPLFVTALGRLMSAYLAGPIIKGTEGMKVSQAQLEVFYKIEKPAAIGSDSNARKSSKYKNFTPGSIGARA